MKKQRIVALPNNHLSKNKLNIGAIFVGILQRKIIITSNGNTEICNQQRKKRLMEDVANAGKRQLK